MFGSLFLFSIGGGYRILKMFYGFGCIFTIVKFIIFDLRFAIIFWRIKENGLNCKKVSILRTRYFFYYILLYIIFVYTIVERLDNIHCILIS